MKMNPYLNFDGQCEAAFKFYHQALGGVIEAMMPHAGTPMEAHVGPEWQSKIMHARLVFDGQVLMGSDAPPNYFQKMQGFSVSLQIDTVNEAERIFATLSEGGVIGMPLQMTFWAARFGSFVDRFGTPWMINCEASE